MPIETYRIEVEETDGREGLIVDVYGGDDLVERTASIAYEEYGIEPTSDDGDPSAVVREVTADVTTTDLQLERDGGGFSVRLLGDRDELATVRVDDEEWGLSSG